MKLPILSKIIKSLAILAVIAGIIIFLGHNYINTIEKRQTIVEIPKKTAKTLFFYRDDCSDCQAVFHQVFWHDKFSKHDVLFINTNQTKNRKYIEEYQLDAVPTFINSSDERYTGTDLAQIKKVVGEK